MEPVRPDAKVVLSVRVNFPKEGETVTHPAYTFQLGAMAGAVRVDVRIDEGPWARCRESLGLWWHEWNSGVDGPHSATARVWLADGTIRFSEPRAFLVRLKD